MKGAINPIRRIKTQLLFLLVLVHTLFSQTFHRWGSQCTHCDLLEFSLTYCIASFSNVVFVKITSLLTCGRQVEERGIILFLSYLLYMYVFLSHLSCTSWEFAQELGQHGRETAEVSFHLVRNTREKMHCATGQHYHYSKHCAI